MNFVEHQTKLQNLLTTSGGKQYSGCYVYSRDEKDTTHKIGMSQSGLFTRLRSAKSCYPHKNEFWLSYVIIALDGHFTKGRTSSTIKIERELHKESKHLSTVEIVPPPNKSAEEGKRPREYRMLSSMTQMHKLLKTVLNKHRDMWNFVIVFSKGGWHIVKNDKVVSTHQLKPKRTATTTPTIDSMPLHLTNVAMPKGLKVGDVVPASDNWAKFTVVEVISKKHVVAKFKGSKTLYDIKL
jgi:hypothetical protein